LFDRRRRIMADWAKILWDAEVGELGAKFFSSAKKG
jgi:hypothetical protein